MKRDFYGTKPCVTAARFPCRWNGTLVLLTITNNNYGDYASVLGLIITAVGFPVTIWKVLKSKEAAEAAKEAVEKVKKDIAAFDALAELSEAVAALDEIKDLHREGAWYHLPRRYSSLRKRIVLLREAFPKLPARRSTALHTVVQQLKIMEEEMDRTRYGQHTPDVERINRTVSEMQDRLNELFAEIKTQIGR